MDRLLFRLRDVLPGKYGVAGKPFRGAGHTLHIGLPCTERPSSLLCHQGNQNRSFRPDHLRAKIN